jgi:hypothetical protein
MNLKSGLIGIFVLISLLGYGQEELFLADSVILGNDAEFDFVTVSDKDPNKAAMLSAILPGLGQAYNDQVWKIPIIYGGAAIFAHFIRYNHRLYHTFRTAEIAIRDSREDTINPFEEVAPGRFGAANITRNRENYRRNRDFMMIMAGVFYLVNIAEAHIAAHLKEFDVNESLSLAVRPTIQNTPLFSRSTGVSFVITF